MTSCQTFYCTNEKGKCEKNCFFFILQLPIRTTLFNTSTSDHEKHGKVRQHWRQKKKKKTCVRIKRVKSDSYLTYGQSSKTYIELYVDTPPPPPPKKIPINSFVL